jgi:hypothetical protein
VLALVVAQVQAVSARYLTLHPSTTAQYVRALEAVWPGVRVRDFSFSQQDHVDSILGTSMWRMDVGAVLEAPEPDLIRHGIVTAQDLGEAPPRRNHNSRGRTIKRLKHAARVTMWLGDDCEYEARHETIRPPY